MISTELSERIRAVSRTPQLLVVWRYEGVLALQGEILGAPHQGVPEMIGEVSSLPWTTTTVLSGAPFREVAARLGNARPHLLAGAHGAQWQGEVIELNASQRECLSRLAAVIGPAAAAAGVPLEKIPGGLALDVQDVDKDIADTLLTQAIDTIGESPDIHIRGQGSRTEFVAIMVTGAEALRRARHASGATGVIYVTADPNDEETFKALNAEDVAITLAQNPTPTRHVVESIEDVLNIARELCEARRRWAAEREIVRLEGCAVISDQRTAAVISPGAKISWLCMPRLDSGALFASLLGDATAGYFEISLAQDTPGEPATPARCGYDGDSFVAVTHWPGLHVTDYLDSTAGRAFQKAGRADLIRVIEGTAPARIRFAPRLDYGRIATQLKVRPEGLEIEGSNDPIVLRSEGVEWKIVREGVHATAEAIVTPANGPIVLELRYGTAGLGPAFEPEPQRRDQNIRFWSGWARSLKLPGKYPELVKRSALVLKALCYGPTGVIAAAATTSLPEQVGGIRNWDYRYCWPRDAAKAAASLVRLGNTGHALKFLDWMLEVVDRCETPDRLHPIYTLSGAHLPPEADLGHLAGYAQSKPVRVGNAASNQVQLDVFGPIVNLVSMLAERGAPIAPDHWRLVRAMVRAVETRWMEPDHGIWEMRLERRHHVHSKVMCWHTIDRALIVEDTVRGTRNPDWMALRDAIRDDVLAHGWSRELNAFGGAYGYHYPDAAVLELGLSGLLDHRDPRWAATVDMVSRELRDGPTVRRYRVDDGLPGDEGGMHICTGWLIDSLVTLGRIDEASTLFDTFAARFSGPGILTEQYDPRHDMAVGNLAQAYSHLAFIDSAIALSTTR